MLVNLLASQKGYDVTSKCQSVLTFLTPFRIVSIIHFSLVTTSVADLHHFDANPDPAFHFNEDPDPTTHFFPDLDPPMLQNDPLRLPPSHFDADPDPTSQANPCGSGSGSGTLVTTLDD